MEITSNIIISSVIFVGIISAIMGLLIAFASKVFYVKEDTRVADIEKLLPQFNCGACGTPGCHAMAQALVAQEISIEKCRPAKPEVKQAINDKLIELDIKVV